MLSTCYYNLQGVGWKYLQRPNENDMTEKYCNEYYVLKLRKTLCYKVVTPFPHHMDCVILPMA